MSNKIYLTIWTAFHYNDYIKVGLFLLSPALAGTRRACRAGEGSSARVYARYVSLELLWGSKVENFLGHFWLSIFVQANLPVNLKQEV